MDFVDFFILKFNVLIKANDARMFKIFVFTDLMYINSLITLILTIFFLEETGCTSDFFEFPKEITFILLFFARLLR